MTEPRQLTKRYRPVVAVAAISAVIAAGSVTGLLGPNGAGKTTTLPMIAGLDRPPRARHSAPDAEPPDVTRACS